MKAQWPNKELVFIGGKDSWMQLIHTKTRLRISLYRIRSKWCTYDRLVGRRGFGPYALRPHPVPTSVPILSYTSVPILIYVCAFPLVVVGLG